MIFSIIDKENNLPVVLELVENYLNPQVQSTMKVYF